MSLKCALGFHQPRVRFFFNSRLKLVGRQTRSMCAVAVCERCGKELSPPANQPRRSA
jgi:hypothetical protein